MIKLNYFIFLLSLFILNITDNNLFSQEKADTLPEVGIVEHLGMQLPMELKFTNSDGNLLSLKEIITKPTVLSLVYYHCPGICSPLMTGLCETVDKLALEPGREFQVVTVSFDHREKKDMALKWKNSYLSGMQKKLPENTWYFMTGDSTSIRKLSDAVGFYFKFDGVDDYIHPAGIYIISPEGKIMRYMYGTTFLPADLKLALLDAGKEVPSPTINKILQFCYSYDPEGHRYTLSFTRIAGAVIILGLGVFFIILLIRKKGKKRSG